MDEDGMRDSWVVGATYRNKHNGSTLRVAEEEVQDNGNSLWRVERLEPSTGSVWTNKYDKQHWDRVSPHDWDKPYGETPEADEPCCPMCGAKKKFWAWIPKAMKPLVESLLEEE